MKNNSRTVRLDFKKNFNTTVFYNMQLCVNFEELPQ